MATRGYFKRFLRGSKKLSEVIVNLVPQSSIRLRRLKMQNAGKLTVTTPTDREIVITRIFDAPRKMVWETMSKPELLKRWLFGPPGWSMVACDDDLRVGGNFRWVWSGPDGAEMALRGIYQEVEPPERIARTEVFEFGGAPAGEQHATLVLLEQEGKTALTLTLRYASKEARDAALASGVERGVAAGYDKLDELLVIRSAADSLG
jgi:uncharacterized protein YndB with AHSA1/START domain